MTARTATIEADTPTTTLDRPSAEVYDRIQMLQSSKTRCVTPATARVAN